MCSTVNNLVISQPLAGKLYDMKSWITSYFYVPDDSNLYLDDGYIERTNESYLYFVPTMTNPDKDIIWTATGGTVIKSFDTIEGAYRQVIVKWDVDASNYALRACQYDSYGNTTLDKTFNFKKDYTFKMSANTIPVCADKKVSYTFDFSFPDDLVPTKINLYVRIFITGPGISATAIKTFFNSGKKSISGSGSFVPEDYGIYGSLDDIGTYQLWVSVSNSGQFCPNISKSLDITKPAPKIEKNNTEITELVVSKNGTTITKESTFSINQFTYEGTVYSRGGAFPTKNSQPVPLGFSVNYKNNDGIGTTAPFPNAIATSWAGMTRYSEDLNFFTNGGIYTSCELILNENGTGDGCTAFPSFDIPQAIISHTKPDCTTNTKGSITINNAKGETYKLFECSFNKISGTIMINREGTPIKSASLSGSNKVLSSDLESGEYIVQIISENGSLTVEKYLDLSVDETGSIDIIEAHIPSCSESDYGHIEINEFTSITSDSYNSLNNYDGDEITFRVIDANNNTIDHSVSKVSNWPLIIDGNSTIAFPGNNVKVYMISGGCNSEQVSPSIVSGPQAIITGGTVDHANCIGDNGTINIESYTYAGVTYNKNSTDFSNFSFYGGITNGTVGNLSASEFFNFEAKGGSSYTLKVVNGDNGCYDEFTRTIDDGIPIKYTENSVSTNPSCSDINIGLLSFSTEGGNRNNTERTYQITSSENSYSNSITNNSETLIELNDLTTGTYEVTVFDGCYIDGTVLTPIYVPSYPEIDADIVTKNITCHDANDGIIRITPTVGDGDFIINNSSLTITLNETDSIYNLSEGIYQITLTDVNGCTNTYPDISIDNPPSLKFTTDIDSFTHVTCWGRNDGQIPVSASGGTGQLYFTIENGTPEIGSFNVSSNNYSYTYANLPACDTLITVTDDNGCPLTQNYILTQPDEYFVNTLSPTGALCFGGSDGSLSVSAMGGSPDGSNYTYNLMDENNNQVNSLTGSTANFTGLEFGDYYVNILDSRNCPLNSETVSISQPEEMTITPLKTSASCFDSENITLTARVKGGTEPYTFQWKDINDSEFGENDSTMEVYTGTYFVNVIDRNNCAYGRTAIGLTPIPFRFDATRPDTLEITIDNQIDVDYNGLSNGSVSLGSTGGWSFHQYSIDGIDFQNSSIFSNLSIGDYTFYVKDGSDCSNSITTTITEPAPFTVSLNNNETQDVNCFNGSDGQITINAEGGRPPYSFTLDNGEGNIITQSSNVFENLPAGNYKIDVGYNTYTETINNIFISQPGSALTSVIDNYQQPKCTFADGWATVNASGGTGPYSYTWNNQQVTSTATNLSSGDYFVEVTDGNNCIDTAFLTLYDIEGPELNVTQINDLTCFDSDNVGSITLNVSGGNEPYNIQWNDANNQTGLTASNLGAGNYSATVTDDDGCISILEDLIITRPEELSATLADFKDPACYNDTNGEITIAGNGGTAPYHYQWQNIDGNPTTATVTGLAAGTYEVLITDEHNCTATASNTLMNPEEIIINLPDSVFICQGQTATLDAGNLGALFEWVADNGFSSNQQIINVQDQGAYLLQVSNVEGCSNTAKTYVKFENRQFYGTFLMSGEATMTDTVIVIELSKPQPDSVQWYITDDFMRLVDGNDYKELIPLQTGDFVVGMKAYFAGCEETVEKRISIIPADNSTNQKAATDALIQKAKLFPNPNTGQFEVEVNLAKEADISADVFSMKGMRMIPTKYDYGKKDYILGFNLMQLNPGVYFVNIMVENEVRKLKFIVN